MSIRNRHHTNPLRAPRQLIDECYLRASRLAFLPSPGTGGAQYKNARMLTGSPRAESNTVVQESLYGAVEGS